MLSLRPDGGSSASWTRGQVPRHGLVLHEVKGEVAVLSVADHSISSKMGVQIVVAPLALTVRRVESFRRIVCWQTWCVALWVKHAPVHRMPHPSDAATVSSLSSPSPSPSPCTGRSYTVAAACTWLRVGLKLSAGHDSVAVLSVEADGGALHRGGRYARSARGRRRVSQFQRRSSSSTSLGFPPPHSHAHLRVALTWCSERRGEILSAIVLSAPGWRVASAPEGMAGGGSPRTILPCAEEQPGSRLVACFRPPSGTPVTIAMREGYDEARRASPEGSPAGGGTRLFGLGSVLTAANALVVRHNTAQLLHGAAPPPGKREASRYLRRTAKYKHIALPPKSSAVAHMHLRLSFIAWSRRARPSPMARLRERGAARMAWYPEFVQVPLSLSHRMHLLISLRR